MLVEIAKNEPNKFFVCLSDIKLFLWITLYPESDTKKFLQRQTSDKWLEQIIKNRLWKELKMLKTLRQKNFCIHENETGESNSVDEKSQN